jgi:predicted outer membrane repeat protein
VWSAEERLVHQTWSYEIGKECPTLTDCTFTNNTADDSGGGMYNMNFSPTLTDTTVCGNTPDQIYGDWTDNGGNTIADVCPDQDCPDINGDGNVNVSDLLVVIDQWGLTNSPADLNLDGTVDVSDLLIVVGNWGPCE